MTLAKPTPSQATKPKLSTKPEQFTESVIREMTRLALQYDAVNLSQGFPDFPAPVEIKRAAQEVTSASAEISGSTTDLSQRTEEQAASLEETSASMEEIAATVKKNAENAQQANQSTAKARDIADRSGKVVADAVAAMAQIETSSGKIADIIGVIDEIARQTNL